MDSDDYEDHEAHSEGLSEEEVEDEDYVEVQSCAGSKQKGAGKKVGSHKEVRKGSAKDAVGQSGRVGRGEHKGGESNCAV